MFKTDNEKKNGMYKRGAKQKNKKKHLNDMKAEKR